MDQITFPTDVPPELKAADLVLKRAKELKAHDAVMCYWCCYRAAQIGVTDKRTKEGTMVLLDLLDALEKVTADYVCHSDMIKMKELLKDNDAVTNEIAGQAYVENFALRVFNGADDEDRAGKATPATIRKFLAAATFLEVVRSFGEGELEPDMEAKLKYARFKAASLAKAFKSGVPPQAGPPVVTAPADETLAALAQARDEASAGPSTQTWSAAATPGQVGEEHDLELRSGPEGFPFAGEEEGSAGSRAPLKRKNSKVRFEGLPGDVTPGSDIVSDRESPALPSFPEPPSLPSPTVDETDDAIPSAPTFIRSRTPSPSPNLPPTQPITPDKPHSIQISPLPPTDLTPPPQPPSFPTPQPAAVSPPWKTAPAPAPPPPAANPSEPLSLAQIEKIQKHAKWAISALNYEDIDTARSELREALRLLG